MGKRRLFFAVIPAIVLLGLTGCASSVDSTRQISSRTEKSDFANRTENRETEMVVEPLMAFHTLSIRNLKLSAGSLILTLSGPDDTVIWQETFTSPASFHRDLELDSLLGKWILRIELAGATGSYDITWRAANIP